MILLFSHLMEFNMSTHDLAFSFFCISFAFAVVCQSANVYHKLSCIRADRRSDQQKRIDLAMKRRPF